MLKENLDSVVCVCHYNNDISWVQTLKYPFVILSNKNVPITNAQNRACEAGLILRYIITNYYVFPDYALFVHDHLTSDHYTKPINKFINEKLIFSQPYKSIIAFTMYNKECTYDLSGTYKIFNPYVSYFESIFNTKIDLCEIQFSQCASFYVSKEAVHRNSLETYVKLWAFLASDNNKLSTRYCGILYEWLWGYIFTGSFKQEHDLDLAKWWGKGVVNGKTTVYN